MLCNTSKLSPSATGPALKTPEALYAVIRITEEAALKMIQATADKFGYHVWLGHVL